MLISDVLNSVTFKDLSGSLPSSFNRLHNDRRQAGLTIVPYWQKYSNGDTFPLQFVSDSINTPVLKSFAPGLVETINGTLAASRIGVDSRYYFNFEIILGASYHDKIVYFTLDQSGSNSLTSEPICVSDLAADLQNGYIKKIEYSNLDPNTSSSKNFINWEVLDDPMFVYVEGMEIYTPSGAVDILETTNSIINVASKLSRGQTFKTGGIPDYFAEKIIKASIMDFFAINNILLVNPEVSEPEQFGNSTLFQLEIPLTEPLTVGLNVDDLGIGAVISPEEMSIINKKNINAFGTFQIQNDEGYMIHAIWLAHNSTSVPTTAVINCGTTPLGKDIIDDIQGSVDKTKYIAQSNTFKTLSRHLLIANTTAKTLYFTVTGAGADMYVSVNFDTVN